jgi:hypothetical protein
MTNNILPDVWGPHGWKFIHFVALGYPDNPSEETKKHYQQFFESIQFILPCQSCATHYQKNIQRVPISEYLKDRDTLMRWTIDLHNEVNKQQQKPTLSYEEALKLYTERQYPVLDALWKPCLLILLLIVIYLYFVR